VLTPLLEDVTPADVSNFVAHQETPHHVNQKDEKCDETGGNPLREIKDEQLIDCSRVEGDCQNIPLCPYILDTCFNSADTLNANHTARNTLNFKTDYDKNIESSNTVVLLDLPTPNSETISPNCAEKDKQKSQHCEAVSFKSEKAIKSETKNRRCSMPSLSNPTSNIRNHFHSLKKKSGTVTDYVIEKKTDSIIETERLTTEEKTNDEGKYRPRETPNWLKLLQRYHDTRRLEKQIQRQREAWARNKRNLRRESVPKCMSGLSRYVF
jgi:hypothetical protein